MKTRIALALTAALAVVAAAAEQPQIFRSGAEAVQADVQVMHRGKPVLGLDASNFELKDSGVLQKVSAISFADLPVSLLLALDTSQSVRGILREDLRRAARGALTPLRPDDRVALISFSERVELSADWTSDRDLLHKVIGALPSGGGTALYDCLMAALASSKSATGRTVLLLFTDGTDTASWTEPLAILDVAMRSELVVYFVYGPTQPDLSTVVDGGRVFRSAPLRSLLLQDPRLFPHAFVYELADRTGGEVFHVDHTEKLTDVFARIVREFRSRYLLTFSPRGVPPSGWHPIQVTLKGTAGNVRARRGYFR